MDKRITIPFSPGLKKADTVAYIGFDREPLTPISREHATAVFEQLGEILGARPISPELAAGLWEMFSAARNQPGLGARDAFVDVLTNGLKYSARGRPEGVKAPEPVPPAKRYAGGRILIRERNDNASEPGLAVRHEDWGAIIETDRVEDLESIAVSACDLPALVSALGGLPEGTKAPRPVDVEAPLGGRTASQAQAELDRLADHLVEAVAPEKKEPSAWDVRHAIADWLNYADDRHAPDCTIHNRGMNWTNCDCRKARDEIFRVLPWYVVDADDAMDDDLQESIRRVIEADHHGRKIEDYDRDQLACKIVAIVEAARPKASQPALSSADVRALRWAVQRAAEAALPIGEGELRQRALAAAGRLAATATVPVADPRQAELASQAARFLTALQGGETPAARALEGIGVPLVPTLYEGVMKFIAEWAEGLNRRSGSPGSPESDDRPEATGSKGGEDSASAIGSLAARLAVAEAKLQAADLHRAVYQEVNLRLVEMEERLHKAEAAVQALELHRRGLNDGAAEMAASGADVITRRAPRPTPAPAQPTVPS